MTDECDDADPTRPPDANDTVIAREHAARAIASAREWDCRCLCCMRVRASGWSPENDQCAHSMTERVAAMLLGDALDAIVRLSFLRGTLAAGKAREVACAGVFALSSPNNAESAAKVVRAWRGLCGADERGERLIIFEIERSLSASRSWHASDEGEGIRRLRNDLAAHALAYGATGPMPDEETTGSILAAVEAGEIKVSGAIARLLVEMRWSKGATFSSALRAGDAAAVLKRVTSLVSRALAARDERQGKKPTAARPKRRTHPRRKVHS